MGKRSHSQNRRCDILETVWSEPGSPVSEQPVTRAKIMATKTANTALKAKAFFATLDTMLSDGSEGSPDGDPDQLFLLPDRVLTVDSLTFREELAAVAPTFLSPVTPTTPSGGGFGKINNANQLPHSSLESTDSNRSSVRLVDDTEGLIITRACNGCLWLCKQLLIYQT